MTNPNVKWSDVKGLSSAKRLLDEAIVLPTRYPDLFTGLCSPWTAMLFYGPPGTGMCSFNNLTIRTNVCVYKTRLRPTTY